MQGFAGSAHLVALALSAALAITVVPLARLRPGRWVTVASVLLGVFLIGQELAYEVVLPVAGRFSTQYSLPLYLCDVAAFVAGAALIRPKPLLVELTWFWAMAGTLQGLLTPDVYWPFPSWDWVQYYGDHGGVVLAALLLVAGRGIQPRSWSALRVFAITVAFTAVVAVADVVTGGNYMYLRHVPDGGSLLSLFGPWPQYIVVATGVAGILLLVLDAPFWMSRRRARSGHEAPGPVTKPFQTGRAEFDARRADVG
jgi:hypothetical integral membrane protein (TIGR02206 family)